MHLHTPQHIVHSKNKNPACIISCISQEQNLIFWMLDKLSPVSNMASSISEENVNLNYFTNWWCHSYGETYNFLNIFVGTKLADVIANDMLIVWQMLLPIVFDIVSPIRCHWLMINGDVVTTVKAYLTDVIAMWWCCYYLLEFVWLMLLPMLWLLLLPLLFDFVADVVPTIGVPLIWLLLKALLCQWQMLLPLVGCNLAGVIANGWCCCQVADVMPLLIYSWYWWLM